MHRTSGLRFLRHLTWLLAWVLPALLVLPAAAQEPGTVRQNIKISNSIPLQLDASDQLGRAVAPLGDIDGDGRIELVIGAQGDDDGGTMGQTSDVGAVYIVKLTQNNTLEGSRKISATEGGFTGILNDRDFFGKAVCPLGDFDGDGVPDFAVGASRDDDGGSARGAVWLLFMNDDSTVKGHAKISDTAGNFGGALKDLDEFGAAVSPLGDLDADGTLDLIVGSRLDDDGGTARGAAYVLFLQPDGSVREYTKISSTSGGLVGPLRNNDSFGQAVAGIGDLDGDGIPDAVVGATKDDDGDIRNGAIWVLFLNRDGTVRDEQKISALAGGFVGPLTGSDEFGNAISSMGDLDGDGVRDLAVGAIFDQDPSLAEDTGCVWILFMNPDGTVKAEQKINELVGGFVGDLSDAGEFGEAIHTLGDLDGDGIADLLVGERWRDDVQPNSGAAWLLFMNGVATDPLDAEFTASVTSGFWPLQVDFTDTSFGDARRWTWDFGDGAVSYERFPSHTYTAAGTYTVALTLEGPHPGMADTETKVGLVVVTDPVVPAAEFVGAPLLVDAGDPVAFTDLSTGSVTGWAWDFGDGAVSSEQDPTHVYAVDGTYTVSLTASGPAGSDVETKLDYVVVSTPDPPTAGFSAAPLVADAGTSIDFTDESTGFVTSWDWDFGDGGTSTEQHPTHVYDHPGTYDVALTVASTGGSDTLTRTDYITVTVPPPPVASFTFAPATPVVGTTVVAFTDESTGQILDRLWTFGDGTTSTEVNPTHVFSTPGLKRVVLEVSNDGGRNLTFRNVLVLDATAAVGGDTAAGDTLQRPNPRFSASPLTGNAPLTVFFDDRTAGNPIAWDWDFGDGGTATNASPSHTYATPGTYTVALTATSAAGGTGTTVVEDLIVVLPDPPVADFTADVTAGEAPLTVQFTDLSTGEADTWRWTFGDGQTSSLQNPTHTFTFAGSFDITLTTTGPGGSDVESKIDYVVVVDAPPVVDFAADRTSGRAPLTVFFTELATGNITTYLWDFGDGATSTIPNPNHVYADAGTYTVALTATGPGGTTTETKADYIVVTEPPPVADFGADVTQGLAPLDVQFTDLSTGAVDAWTWDFGDGGSSTETSPLHTYAAAGTYTVVLTVVGPGGSDGETKADYVMVVDAPPVAEFTADVTAGDAPLAVQFTDLSSGIVTDWAWDFGDGGSSTLADPAYTYLAAGTYDVSLTVTGPGGTDPETKLGYVVVTEPPPVADFGSDVTTGDAPLDVQFSDLSGGAVTAWSWDLGDGATSTQEDPLHTYGLPGTYTVALTVTGPGGADTVTKADYVVATTPPAPVADFTADVTTGAAPLTVQFTDLTSGQVDAWAWDFGDGGSSSDRDPAYVYASPGTYTVTLTASGLGGSDDEVKAGYVLVTTAPGGGPPPPPDAGRSPRRVEPPLARHTRRNGSGVNPLGLDAATLPRLGAELVLELTAGSAGDGAMLLLVGEAAPAALPLSGGELLLDPTGRLLWSELALLEAGGATFVRAIPPDVALAGLALSAQGRLTGPAGTRWTNAVDLVLGR